MTISQKESTTTEELNVDKNISRRITPEPKPSLLVDVDFTPKADIIDSTENKENASSQEKKKLLLLCNRSDVVLTSFAPRI